MRLTDEAVFVDRVLGDAPVEELEAAREAMHAEGATDQDRARYKALAREVAQARTAAKQQREAEPPEEVPEGDAVVDIARLTGGAE